MFLSMTVQEKLFDFVPAYRNNESVDVASKVSLSATS